MKRSVSEPGLINQVNFIDVCKGADRRNLKWTKATNKSACN